MKNISLFIAFFFFLISFAFAQGNHQELFRRVDSLFSPWAKANSPGAAIGIYNDGELIYTQGYGMSNLEYDIPIKPNSIFHIASISKQFTNFAILLLEEEGKLSLDDDIRKHLPEIHDFGKTITIRHLMHHTSGFRDQWQLLAIAGWRMDDVITKDHIMKIILGQRALNFEPGSEYRYSNAGYSILARIVDKVSGQDFSEFAQKRIFEPLEMDDTHIHDDHERIVPRRTYSYYPTDNGFKNGVLSYANDGATSMFTTVEDMGKWIENMLHPDLGKSFVGRMRKKGKLNNGKEIDYGLGQSIGTYKGLDYAGHGGADAGFRSSIRWYPEFDFGVVVLSNLGSFNPSEKINQITDIFLNNFIEMSKAKEKVELIELPLEELLKFRGRYTISDAGLNFKIDTAEKKLRLFMEWNGGSMGLLPYASNKFIDDGNLDLKFTFLLEDDQVIKAEIQTGDNISQVEKFVDYPIDQEKLHAFTGNYYCPETDSYYRIILTDDGLKATHNRHEDISLIQKGELAFNTSAWWIGRLTFVKGKKGKITGFLVGGGRVTDLRFNKVDVR